jgi:predicted permease
MDTLKELWRRLVVLLRPSRFDAELEEEMSLHLALAAEDRETQGLSPAAARDAARQRFGNPLLLREDSRATWGWTSLEAVVRDVRLAFRTMRRSPTFTFVAVISLAVGIGLNAVVFSVLDATLFRPLPARDPGQLVDIFTSTASGDPYGTNAYPDYFDLRAQNTTCVDLLAFSPIIAPQNLGDRSRFVAGEAVTGNYFRMLGVGAHVGRVFVADDDRPGAQPVVVVSWRYWQRQMDGVSDVVGRSIRIRGNPYTIVGVAPEWFTGTTPLLAPAFWIPMQRVGDAKAAGTQDQVASPTGTSRLDRRGQRWVYMKGRLKPGTTAEMARANLQVVMAQLGQTYPETNKGRRVAVIPTSDVRLHPAINRVLTPIAAGIMIAVGLALLIVSANVASMLLARASARAHEMAVRQAIGAGRWQLMRQSLIETLTLTALGAVGGITLAWWIIATISSLELPIAIPVSLSLSVDGRTICFAAVVALLAGLAAGLPPALRASRADVLSGLQARGNSPDTARRRWALRDVLVAGQTGVAVVLLVSAGLLARSLVVSSHARVGFDLAGLAHLATEPSMAGYDGDQSEQFWIKAIARVSALPGVEHVALASRFPFSIGGDDSWLHIPGHNTPGDEGTTVASARVSPDYFGTLGVRLLEGRAFAATDTSGTPRVAIVNATMAHRFWPRESAVGKRVFVRDSDDMPVEIVGVVADHRIHTVGEGSLPQIFFAIHQRFISYAALAVRTKGDADRMVGDMRRALLGIEPNLVFMEDRTMEAMVETTLLPVQAGAWLVGGIGLVGAALAAIGLYGIIAFSVARRTREIGIRLAIGSSPADIRRLVMRQGLTVTAVGAAVGLLLAAASAVFIARIVYGVGVADPLAWGGAMACLLLLSAAANAIPAWRASRLDPVIALHIE